MYVCMYTGLEIVGVASQNTNRFWGVIANHFGKVNRKIAIQFS